MATHSSILAWRIPWTEGPGRLWSIGSQRVGYDRSYLARVHAVLVKNVEYSRCICVSGCNYLHSQKQPSALFALEPLKSP